MMAQGYSIEEVCKHGSYEGMGLGSEVTPAQTEGTFTKSLYHG